MAFTFFFRDSETLELAIERLLPTAHKRERIEIWDAGCAHGPEPYTLAILLREKMPEAMYQKVRIYATDVDSDFADQVNNGIFPESELRRLPPGILDKYFEPLGDTGRFVLVDEIRSRISFAHHDLLAYSPFRKQLALIVCKNVLLHFQEEQRCRVLRMFHDALHADGVLVMEQTQKIPSAVDGLFRQLVHYAQVFGKTGPSPKAIVRIDRAEGTPRFHLEHQGGKTKPKNGPWTSADHDAV